MICRSIFYKNMMICSDFSHPCYSHSSIFFFFFNIIRHGIAILWRVSQKEFRPLKKIELFSRCFTRSVILTWWSYNMKEQLVKISDPGNNPKKSSIFFNEASRQSRNVWFWRYLPIERTIFFCNEIRQANQPLVDVANLSLHMEECI